MGFDLTDDDALAQLVYAPGGYKAFGEFTCEDVQTRAAELMAATGWGPTARVASVARGWSELARMMATAGAQRVSQHIVERVGDLRRHLLLDLQPLGIDFDKPREL